MSDDELPPELDDFETQLKNIQTHKPKQSKSTTSEDYTKLNTRHIEDEAKLAEQMQKVKLTEQKLSQKLQATKKKQEFGGMKKGFFGGSSKTTSTVQQKPQKITQVKATNKNPLQIKQVQQAMKMNNYLDQTRKQWMTDNFLDNVNSNQKISKLFSNPEYMKAIDMFKTNPKEAMIKYGNNKQFMEGFQEFCKMMGNQFQNLAKQPKK